jgi:hypothetical protein
MPEIDPAALAANAEQMFSALGEISRLAADAQVRIPAADKRTYEAMAEIGRKAEAARVAVTHPHLMPGRR